ncbi:MAG: Potassium efflux system KefA protein / Small-conductance mechanosensitive channel [Candidatus Bipolaricaulis sibiricus]|uniref:Potassium efflux system KefA protein / Small-conductance mechanosensitive channel n=1 Tax=Bipolaricaulis sibiricus TaxID=2501609 RepID=A0A410FWB2_BIPS1|nr:MAG: Potassium efflux system KefA protein / Small-conductance mechanosensitive channel [Candidatus Bipolaricaulis sibiricus]
MTFLHEAFAYNEVWVWFVALGIFIGTFALLRLLKWTAHRRLKALRDRTQGDLPRLVVNLIRSTSTLFLVVVALFAAAQALTLPPGVGEAIATLALIAFLFQCAGWGARGITHWVNRTVKYKLEEEKDAASATSLNAVAFLGKIALWTVALLLALDNLGIDITALVTGLGIAGIAVALALQNILSDLFASISIVVDKPFLVGDFIVVGEMRGTVQRIGLKTTRIRSLTGEQVVVANSELLRQRIHNYKQMQERRATFSFGVVYSTPPDQLAAIPALVREVVEAQPHTRFDRAHFKEYGEYALAFEVVYWMLRPDYNLYMDTQQAINLELYRRFAAAGIHFAYPTHTVYIHPPSENDHGR